MPVPSVGMPLERLVMARASAHLLVGSSAALTAAGLTVARDATGSAATALRLVPALLLVLAGYAAWRRARAGVAPALDRRAVLACCAVVLVLASIGPVRASRDLWAYAMYGRIASVHHADPYVDPPRQFPDDPYLQLMNPNWHGTRSVYGPAFNAYAAVVTKLTGDSVDATRLVFKFSASACVLAGLLLLARRRVDPSAIAFAGLHPAVVAYGVAGGHNDALVGLALLAGALLAATRRPVAAGAALAAACLVKVAAGLAIAAVVVWLWHRRDDLARRHAVAAAAAFGGLVSLGYLLAGGATALGPLRTASGMTSWTSFWRPLGRWLDATPVGGHASTAAIGLVLVVSALVLLRHRHDDGPEVLLSAVLLCYLVASAYALVWYLMWVVPLAALRWRTPTAWLVAALATAYLVPTSVRVGLQGTALLIVVLLVVASIRHRPGPILPS